MKSLLSCGFVLLLALTQTSRADEALDNARQAQTKVDHLQTEHMRQMEELESATAKAKVPLFKERGDVVRNIKGFWKSVFVNHPSHTNWVHGQDKEILEYLLDFRVEDIGEYQAGYLRHYKIVMTFTRENPYFEDSVLSREIKGIAQGPGTKVSGIQWLGGKKPQGASFFNFFEEAGGHGEQLLEHIYNDMAHVMRYEFWPNPFSYYDLPTNERFAAEHANHHYQAELDAANDGGIPSTIVTEEIQEEVRKGNTPVRENDTPTSSHSTEDILKMQQEEEARAKKAKEVEDLKGKRAEDAKRADDAAAAKKSKKAEKEAKQAKKETKPKKDSSKSKSASKSKKADKYVDPEGVAAPSDDEGF